MPSRENAKKSCKDLNLSNTRKLKVSESKESESNIISIPISSNFMLFALKKVQKSARAEGSSTDRKSNKSGFEGLSSEERSKLRDLRSIYYKQTNLNKTSSEKTSARNRSSSKMLASHSELRFHQRSRTILSACYNLKANFVKSLLMQQKARLQGLPLTSIKIVGFNKIYADSRLQQQKN